MEEGARNRIGVSACLLGQAVRHDGGHKRDAFLAEAAARVMELVPVCPEVEFGLGTPREPIRLVLAPGGLRLSTLEGGRDLTAGMRGYAEKRVAALGKMGLCGYVFKQGSPSCGLEGVAVARDGGSPLRDGRGLFAGVFMERNGGLPVEEEGRLQEPAARKKFFEKVFAYGGRGMDGYLEEILSAGGEPGLAEAVAAFRRGLSLPSL